MKKAKIFYFISQNEQTKEEKLDWFERTRFGQTPFDHITRDQKSNWINLADNDFDSLLPLIDKEVKAGRSQEAVFQLFSRGLEIGRDEWIYDFSETNLTSKIEYLIQVYKKALITTLWTKFEQILRLKPLSCREQDLFFQVSSASDLEKIARSLSRKL